jgi:predicted DNA-binding transcriptional regulator YafY
MSEPCLKIEYTNYKGVRSWRTIRPIALYHGEHRPFYHGKRWLLRAWDVDRQAERVFDVHKIHGWDVPPPEPEDGAPEGGASVPW